MISTGDNLGGKPQDTSNRFQVVRCKTIVPPTAGEAHLHNQVERPGVVIERLVGQGEIVLSIDSAVNLAAWLVAMADPEMKVFPRVLEEVRK